MNGKGLIVTVISVGVGLGALTTAIGGLILSGQSSMKSDIRAVQEDIGDLRERMAHLEGRVDTLVEVMAKEDSE